MITPGHLDHCGRQVDSEHVHAQLTQVSGDPSRSAPHIHNWSRALSPHQIGERRQDCALFRCFIQKGDASGLHNYQRCCCKTCACFPASHLFSFPSPWPQLTRPTRTTTRAACASFIQLRHRQRHFFVEFAHAPSETEDLLLVPKVVVHGAVAGLRGRAISAERSSAAARMTWATRTWSAPAAATNGTRTTLRARALVRIANVTGREELREAVRGGIRPPPTTLPLLIGAPGGVQRAPWPVLGRGGA